jgi:hypothetical protein
MGNCFTNYNRYIGRNFEDVKDDIQRRHKKYVVIKDGLFHTQALLLNEPYFYCNRFNIIYKITINNEVLAEK